MARLKELKTNFVAGEIDPLLYQRSDVKAYFNGAKYLRNVVALPQGGVRSRPGTLHVWEVPMAPGDVVSNVRMFEFSFATDQTYLFIFHHNALSIFRNNELQNTFTTPYGTDELRAQTTPEGDLITTGISVTQSRDTMLVFHQNHAIRQIKRNGAHDDWTVSNYAVRNIPRFDFGDTTYTNGVDEVQKLEFPNPGSQGDWTEGDTFKLILEDEKTDNIQFSHNSITMNARLQAALRRLPNVTAAGVTVTSPTGDPTEDTVFTLTLSGENGNRPWGALAYENVSTKQVPSIEIVVSTPGERQGEPVWSTARGWPRCGCFFGGRLWMAGTKFLPNTVWASRAGAFNDFNSKKIDDDYGISATTDTDDVPAFINIFPGRHLQLFSTAAEFYIPISETEPVTPANIVLRRTSSRGSKPGLRVFEVDGATHFVQRFGKALRELIFADVELAYQANNISLLASHLMRDPVGFALRRSSSTEDADYEFMPNRDGTMTVFCTLRTQEVNAMTLWTTKGQYDDVAVVLEDVYFSVIRTINGQRRKFIEIMDADMAYDCGKTVSGYMPGAPYLGDFLPWLPSTLVGYEVDGFVMDEKITFPGGYVEFDRISDIYYKAGLKFPVAVPAVHPTFTWLVQTLPFETQLQDGASMGRKRRVVNADVRLFETSALVVNGQEIAFRTFGPDVLDTPLQPFSGVKRARGFLGWDYDGQVTMGSDVSTKATVLGLAYSVSIG